jgi:hypothetical protein
LSKEREKRVVEYQALLRPVKDLEIAQLSPPSEGNRARSDSSEGEGDFIELPASVDRGGTTAKERIIRIWDLRVTNLHGVPPPNTFLLLIGFI